MQAMGDCSLFHLVFAVTLASLLSHISLLILLGRRDELAKGVDMLTEGFTGLTAPRAAWGQAPVAPGMGLAPGMGVAPGWGQAPAVPVGCNPAAASMPYRMYDESMPAIPRATPAGDPGFGAPIDWGTTPRPRSAGSAGSAGSGVTQNYYLN